MNECECECECEYLFNDHRDTFLRTPLTWIVRYQSPPYPPGARRAREVRPGPPPVMEGWVPPR